MKNEIEQHKTQMIKEFNSMDKEPIIEYEYKPSEFDIHCIAVNNEGVYIIGSCLIVEWDYILTLDEHLQELYDLIVSSYN